MKLHIVTVGAPKLTYAKAGWEEYLGRLQHYHQLRVSHVADKNNDSEHLLAAAKGSYLVILMIDGPQFSSHQLADFLQRRAQTGQEVCFMIGGPDGLPDEVIAAAHQQLGLSSLTFPHDLAMVVLLESLYRASTINDNQPYHR
ncbi:MAG: 23S rRNA (pseudouridine(1915)-N(3))-methyltransferase RlmH [Patescibacteria group bacterium]|nr:23S rRNA (pseudouridine(1915)-N(3))-methyltransferase RlmH [Patescibacteria group bacterium]